MDTATWHGEPSESRSIDRTCFFTGRSSDPRSRPEERRTTKCGADRRFLPMLPKAFRRRSHRVK